MKTHRSQPAIEAIIFDWDGTIVDTREAMYRSYRYAYRSQAGIDFPTTDEEFRQMAAMRLAESSARYGGDRAQEISEAYSRFYLDQGYRYTVLIPGMREAIEQLERRGFQLAVCSNKGRERVVRDADHLGLSRLFNTYVTAEDTQERKPHPAPLLKAAEKLGRDPARCAYVGDYPGDVLAAQAAGMAAIAVLWGFYPEEELAALRPDYLLRTPEELRDLKI